MSGSTRSSTSRRGRRVAGQGTSAAAVAAAASASAAAASAAAAAAPNPTPTNPAATTPAATAQGPPPPVLNPVSASVVATSTPLEDLPCQAVIGLVGGSEAKTDPDRVFLADATPLGDVASTAALGMADAIYELVMELPPVQGGHDNYYEAAQKAEALMLQGAGDGAAAFVKKLAMAGAAESLVRLAQAAGLLKESQGCVWLPNKLEILAHKHQRPLGPTPAAAPGAAAAAAAPAGPAGELGLLSKLVSMLQPAAGKGSEAEVDPDHNEVSEFFTTAHAKFEMHPAITEALEVLRNDSGTEDWYTFNVKLDKLITKTVTLGLSQDRIFLDNVQLRGRELIRAGANSAKVLRVFTDMLPTARHLLKAVMAKDRARIMALNKIAGTNLNKIASTNLNLGSGVARATPARGAHRAAAAAAPAPAARGSNWGPLTLPLQPAALPLQTSGAGTKSRAPRRGGRGGGRQAGGGAAQPPTPPSARAVQERLDYNNAAQAKQEAQTFDPQGHFCQDCAKARRTPHHFFKECAFAECYNCKRGGHRAPACTFPSFP